jgi:hypothetical protein
LAAAPPATFFVPLLEQNMLDLLGAVLELLPDFLIEYFLGQLFRGLQEL